MGIKKNYMYTSVYQILIIILPLILAPYTSRVLGAESVGIYSYSYSIVSYFILFVMLGVNNYGNRSIAMAKNNKEKLNKTFCSIYILQLIVGIIVLILYILYVSVFVQKNKVISIIQIITLLSAILDISWFYFGMENFKLTVTRNISIKIITAICIFLFVKNSNDLIVYTIIMSGGMLIGNLYLWGVLKKYIKLSSISYSDVIEHIKPNLVLFIPVIAISIYKILDKIMLGIISTVNQVGFYEYSEKVMGIPGGLITALGTVMLPRMSSLVAQGDFEKSKVYISNSIKFAMFMAFGMSFGLLSIGKEFAPIFFGEEFSYCGEVMICLSPTIIFIAWANVIRTQYLIPNKRDKVYIISVFIGAFINIIINLILIPQLGAAGAAIGTVFAEASVAIYQTICVRNDLNIKKYIKDSIIFCVSGIFMYIILTLIMSNIIYGSVISIALKVIVGILVYIIVCLIYYSLTNTIYIKNVLNKIIKKSR